MGPHPFVKRLVQPGSLCLPAPLSITQLPSDLEGRRLTGVEREAHRGTRGASGILSCFGFAKRWDPRCETWAGGWSMRAAVDPGPGRRWDSSPQVENALPLLGVISGQPLCILSLAREAHFLNSGS